MMISVVIPVLNGASTIEHCLTALQQQDLPRDFYELWVVDNGSSDSTMEILSRYRDCAVTLSETQIRSSYGARNRGVLASRGDLVAFTDADCVPHPQWLKLIAAAFDDPRVGCAGGEIIAVKPMTWAERCAQRVGLLTQATTLANTYRPYFQTANAAYRREVFDQIGLFDASLESGGDADLCWRLQEQTHWEMCFAENAIVEHHHRTHWQELWKQFKRYGRGRAALQAKYPEFANTS